MISICLALLYYFKSQVITGNSLIIEVIEDAFQTYHYQDPITGLTKS